MKSVWLLLSVDISAIFGSYAWLFIQSQGNAANYVIVRSWHEKFTLTVCNACLLIIFQLNITGWLIVQWCFLADNNTKNHKKSSEWGTRRGMNPLFSDLRCYPDTLWLRHRATCDTMKKYTKLIRAPLLIVMPCNFRSCRVGRTTGYCRWW